jgi:hypothetical protein
MAFDYFVICALGAIFGYCIGRMHAEWAPAQTQLPWRDDIKPIVDVCEFIYIVALIYRIYEFPCGTFVSVTHGPFDEQFVHAWTPAGTLYDSQKQGGPGTTRGEHAALCARGIPSPWKWVD